jgi:DNA-binding SARP family transcriptional activator
MTRAPGYMIRVEPNDLDSARFERLASKGRGELTSGHPVKAQVTLRSALDLWRGTALEDFAYETFAALERGRLAELRATAEEDLIEATLALGGHAVTVADLEGMVTVEPFRERRWEQLMLALYRSNRQADALRTFQRARAVLTEELGIDPGPALRRLEDRILQHDPVLDWRPPVSVVTETIEEPTAVPPAETKEEPSFVGRDAELGALERHILAAGGGVAMIDGGPGIGKSTLVGMLAARARALGWKVAWGRCPETEGAPPSWPWERILADLGEPWDAAGREGRTSFELYVEITRVLLGVTAQRKTLIVLEDLHWADESSLGLLRTLSEELEESNLSVVGTFRATENSAPLVESLAALARLPRHHRLTLRGLDTAAVAELVTRTTGQPADPRVAARVHDRTDGNPFFVTELIKLLVSERRLDDDAIPAVVGDVIRARLARLPEDTQTVLTVAAVAGRWFDLPIVGSAAAIDDDYLLDLIDGAIVTGILTERDDGQVGFCHALVQEALYQDLVGLRRARLHRRIAEALESEPGGADRYVDELAYHYLAAVPAGSGAAALDSVARAAGQAGTRAAHAEAIKYWRQTLELLDVTGSDDGQRRYDAMVGLARAERLLPDPEASRDHYRAAGMLAESAGDFARAALTAVEGSNALEWNWTGYAPDHELIALLRRLIERVGSSDPRIRSLLLSALVVEARLDSAKTASSLAAEALGIARTIDDPEMMFAALHASYVNLQGRPGAPARLALTTEMSEIKDVAPTARATAMLDRVTARVENGDLAVDEDLEVVERLAAGTFQPAVTSYVTWFRSLLLIARGPLDEAERAMESALERNVLRQVAGEPDAYHGSQLLVLRMLQGRLAELDALGEWLAASDVPGWREAGAMILASSGRLDAAAEALSRSKLTHDYTTTRLHLCNGRLRPSHCDLAGRRCLHGRHRARGARTVRRGIRRGHQRVVRRLDRPLSRTPRLDCRGQRPGG